MPEKQLYPGIQETLLPRAVGLTLRPAFEDAIGFPASRAC